jgi:hypothetical protein
MIELALPSHYPFFALSTFVHWIEAGGQRRPLRFIKLCLGQVAMILRLGQTGLGLHITQTLFGLFVFGFSHHKA